MMTTFSNAALCATEWLQSLPAAADTSLNLWFRRFGAYLDKQQLVQRSRLKAKLKRTVEGFKNVR